MLASLILAGKQPLDLPIIPVGNKATKPNPKFYGTFLISASRQVKGKTYNTWPGAILAKGRSGVLTTSLTKGSHVTSYQGGAADLWGSTPSQREPAAGCPHSRSGYDTPVTSCFSTISCAFKNYSSAHSVACGMFAWWYTLTGSALRRSFHTGTPPTKDLFPSTCYSKLMFLSCSVFPGVMLCAHGCMGNAALFFFFLFFFNLIHSVNAEIVIRLLGMIFTVMNFTVFLF